MEEYIEYSSGDDTTPSDEESVVEPTVSYTSTSVDLENTSSHEY